MFLKSREDFEWPQFPKLPLLRCQNSLRVFLPVRSVGFCLRAWPWGRGSRGRTPLILAAEKGHVSVLQRLLEAKAALDAKNNMGRGLGREILGRTPSWGNGIFTWGRGWNVEGSSYFRCFTILWKVFCQNIWHWHFVLFFVILTIARISRNAYCRGLHFVASQSLAVSFLELEYVCIYPSCLSTWLRRLQ